MNRTIKLFFFLSTLLATSLSFANTGLVSCKTNVKYIDGTQESFTTHVNIKKTKNWNNDGFHYEGSRMNKFPSDSSRALDVFSNISDGKLFIFYRGMSKQDKFSWHAGSEYEFNFQLDSRGKTVELIESSETDKHIAIDIESCKTTINSEF